MRTPRVFFVSSAVVGSAAVVTSEFLPAIRDASIAIVTLGCVAAALWYGWLFARKAVALLQRVRNPG